MARSNFLFALARDDACDVMFVQTRSASALRVKLQRLDSSVSSVMAASMGSAFQICCHLFLKVRGS